MVETRVCPDRFQRARWEPCAVLGGHEQVPQEPWREGGGLLGRVIGGKAPTVGSMGWGAVPQMFLLKKKNLFLHWADGGNACLVEAVTSIIGKNIYEFNSEPTPLSGWVGEEH